jgi:hypothetical protein
VEAEHGIVYQSKQSDYDLLDAAGMSYHKSEKRNPNHDEQQVQERREEIKKVAHHAEEISAGEMVVLLEDEGHLLWGDGRGNVWGKRSVMFLSSKRLIETRISESETTATFDKM